MNNFFNLPEDKQREIVERVVHEANEEQRRIMEKPKTTYEILREAIWDCIKQWDLARNDGSKYGHLYANANGTDVETIIEGLRPAIADWVRSKKPVYSEYEHPLTIGVYLDRFEQALLSDLENTHD